MNTTTRDRQGNEYNTLNDWDARMKAAEKALRLFCIERYAVSNPGTDREAHTLTGYLEHSGDLRTFDTRKEANEFARDMNEAALTVYLYSRTRKTTAYKVRAVTEDWLNRFNGR